MAHVRAHCSAGLELSCFDYLRRERIGNSNLTTYKFDLDGQEWEISASESFQLWKRGSVATVSSLSARVWDLITVSLCKPRHQSSSGDLFALNVPTYVRCAIASSSTIALCSSQSSKSFHAVAFSRLTYVVNLCVRSNFMSSLHGLFDR